MTDQPAEAVSPQPSLRERLAVPVHWFLKASGVMLREHLAVPLHWCLVAAGVVVVVSDWPLGSLVNVISQDPRAHLIVRLGLLLLVIWLFRRALGKNLDLYQRLSDPPPPDPPLKRENRFSSRLIDRAWSVTERYDPTALMCFGTTLLFPRSNITRAVEEACLRGHVLVLETALTIDTTRLHPAMGVAADPAPSNHTAQQRNGQSGERRDGDPACPTFVVPIMRAKKGTLIDGLDIESSSNASLPGPSQSETKDLIAYVVADLFWRAYIDAEEPFDLSKLEARALTVKGAEELGPYSAYGVLDELLEAIYAFDAPSFEKLDDAKEVLRGIDVKSRQAHESLVKNVNFLARFYVIAAEVPRPEGKQLVVKYRRSLPPYAQTGTFVDRWALRLGLRPSRFTIPIWLPFIVGSYHFRMRSSSPGQFVAEHYLLDDTEPTKTVTTETLRERQKRETPGTPTEAFLRTQNGRGLLYAHLYAGGFRFREDFGIATVVKFAEIPPGALGGTTVIAAVSAILITTFALLGLPDEGTSTPAILLAASTIAASVLGFATDHDSLLRSSLTSRLGLIAAGLLSLGATLLYLVQSVGGMRHPTWTLGFAGGRMHLTLNLWWVLLSVVSLGCAAHLWWTLMMRMRKYMNEVQIGDKLVHDAIDKRPAKNPEHDTAEDNVEAATLTTTS